MKRRIISAATFAAIVFPQVALAAEEAREDHGSWLLLLFFTINFALFVYVLMHFAAPAVKKFFADRASTIRSGLSRAESAFSEAQDLANEAAARMAALDAELKKLGAELDAETAFQAARIREIANATVARVRRDTGLSTAALGYAAQRRVREQLAATAAALAGNLIASQFQPSDQNRLIDGFMQKLGQGASR
jgi:F-type H+-transporting ATPase subunit b